MNNVNFELYKIFYVVAKYMNITKAAEELMISQPAISQSLKKLEDELGGVLFTRSKTGVTFTTDGEYLYNNLKESIEKMNEQSYYFDDLKKLKLGVLRIGSDTSNFNHFLMDFIKNFHNDYPKIDIKIIRKENRELLNMIDRNEIDIIVLNATSTKMDNIKVLNTFNFNESLVASYELYEQYKDKIIGIKDLEKLPLILLSNKTTSRRNMNSFFYENKIRPVPKYEFDSYSLAMDFIKNGFGIGIVNDRYIQEDLKKKKMFKIKTNFDFPSRKIIMGVSNVHKLGKCANKFLEILGFDV